MGKATVVLILQVECTEKLKQNIDTVQSETYIENSRTWWRLFQKRVIHTKFDIYVFIDKRLKHNQVGILCVTFCKKWKLFGWLYFYLKWYWYMG